MCPSVCGETLPGVRVVSYWSAHGYKGFTLVRVCLLELMHPSELETKCVALLYCNTEHLILYFACAGKQD